MNTKGFNMGSGDEVDYVLHSHFRNRNKQTHYDLRMGTPNVGLYSWAVPRAKLPELKEKLLAKQTKLHDYKQTIGFTGDIPTGSAAGRLDIVSQGKAKLVKVGPGKIVFEIPYGDTPRRFTLVKSNTREGDWILLRNNQQPETVPAPL